MIGSLVELRASRVNTNIPVEEEKNALLFGKKFTKSQKYFNAIFDVAEKY